MPPTLALLLSLLITVAGCDLFGGGDSLRVNTIPTSAVEMSLDIRTTKGGTVRITRDGREVAKFTLNGKDSVFVDSGLSPATTYKWQVRSGGESVSVRAATLDTTSSHFTWQTFSFGGDVGSSVLYDVAIIDENNIWAVGEIYVRDIEHINGYQLYNSAHWDGVEWELKQIPFAGFPASGCGAVVHPPIRAIWHFSDSDIWFAAGGSLVHFNGENYSNDCRMNSLLTGRINKIWGASSKDLYIVGENGSLAHYDGTSWQNVESGTNVPLLDVWGSPDSKRVWTVGWRSSNGQGAVLQVTGSRVQPVWQSGSGVYHPYNGQLLGSLWGNRDALFLTGSGYVFRQFVHKSYIRQEQVALENYAYRVRGNAANDVFIVGDAAMVWHYNGRDWHRFAQLSHADRSLYGLAVADNLVVAVGRSHEGFLSSALLIIGRR